MKLQGDAPAADVVASPPSRGAWIEMRLMFWGPRRLCCRPPRGGRGLKSACSINYDKGVMSPPSRGAWIEMLFLEVFFW